MTPEKLDASYLELINDKRIFESTLAESASIISKHCAASLSVSRASIWISYEDRSELHCLSLYGSDCDSNESGAILKEVSFPQYFQSLATSRVIDARDAWEDHRTCELKDTYLEPLDVRSLLDATIRHQGAARGVVCVEMVGRQRDWNNAEQLFVASIADLISQRIIVEELDRSEEKYKAVYDNTTEGITVFGGDRFVDVNPAMCTMFGAEREELLGKSPISFSPEFQPDGRPSAEVAMQFIQKCLSGEPQNFEWTHSRLDGTPFPANVTLNAVKLDGEETLFALIRDITDEKEAEQQAIVAQEKLAFRAAHDSLTGLLNREQLHLYVDRIITNQCLANNSPGADTPKVALMLLDLNRFKEVNDTLGHATGDQVIIKLAKILNKRISEIGGCLFRLGGDEFVAVFDADACSEPLESVELILHQTLKTSIDLDDISIEMGASIGISLFPQNGSDSHELLRCADVAMYHAKSIDGTSSWYDAQNDVNNKRRLAMIVELGAAIDADQLLLHYQPRINIKSGEVTGCEALVRWQHPKHDMVSPGEFLPLAEMTELIHPLSDWVLTAVVKKIKEMPSRGHHLPIALNVSARNLTDSRLVDKIYELVSAEKIDPYLLEVEITESALINHPQRAVENLNRLDQLGVRIAIDDFGTGYSSLSYLKKLPLDTLKIDQSFVKDMLTDESDSVIVDSTIALAHNFSFTVVAEGVEDQETLDALADKGCDQAQGFYIARPMPAQALDEWLDNHLAMQERRLAS